MALHCVSIRIPVRIGITIKTWKRSLSSRSDNLKGVIRNFLKTHEYTMIPLEAITFKYSKSKGDINYRETFSSVNSKWCFTVFWENNKTYGISSSDIFANGYETLQKYVDDRPIRSSDEPAFRALERFFAEKGN